MVKIVPFPGNISQHVTTKNQGGGGFRCLCRVQNIACYRMRMGIIGDQFSHSVADDLNIYYEQFSRVGTPKFQSRK